MKVEIVPPKPPPHVVVLTLTMEEATTLRGILYRSSEDYVLWKALHDAGVPREDFTE